MHLASICLPRIKELFDEIKTDTHNLKAGEITSYSKVDEAYKRLKFNQEEMLKL